MVLNTSIEGILPVTQEQLVTFDYYDTLRNTGYVGFYPALMTSGAALEVFTETGIYSTDIGTFTETEFWMQDPGGGAITSRALIITADLTFALPQVLKGDMFFNIPLGCANHSSTDPLQLVVSGAIYKVNAAGVQTLINGINNIPYLRYEIATINVAESKVALMKVHTSGAINFAAGEKLRGRFDVYGKSLGAAGQQSYVSYMHDPANRSTSGDPRIGTLYYPTSGVTRQTWLLPFKLT